MKRRLRTGPGNRPVLDEERPVTGHPGQDPLLGMDDVHVVEAGDEQAALDAVEERASRLAAGGHEQVPAQWPERVGAGSP